MTVNHTSPILPVASDSAAGEKLPTDPSTNSQMEVTDHEPDSEQFAESTSVSSPDTMTSQQTPTCSTSNDSGLLRSIQSTPQSSSITPNHADGEGEQLSMPQKRHAFHSLDWFNVSQPQTRLYINISAFSRSTHSPNRSQVHNPRPSIRNHSITLSPLVHLMHLIIHLLLHCPFLSLTSSE